MTQLACARQGTITPDELHPCFICGNDILVGEASHCEECGQLICSYCAACGCNLTGNERETLEYIHSQYCSTAYCILHFESISMKPWMDKNIVNNMEKSLQRCSKRMKEC